MAKNMADAFIAAVKERMNLARDEDLARRFGWGKSTISSWRLRGFVPAEQRTLLEGYSGVSYSEFAQLSFQGPIINWLIEISFLTAFSAAVADLTAKQRKQLIINIFSRTPQIKKKAAERIILAIGSRDLLEAYGDLSSEALAGSFLSVDEIHEAAGWGDAPPEVPQ